MLPVLVADGVYFELCDGKETFPYGKGSVGFAFCCLTSPGFNITSCTEQRVRLSLISSFALTTINIVAPVYGFINDLIGPKVLCHPYRLIRLNFRSRVPFLCCLALQHIFSSLSPTPSRASHRFVEISDS